MVVPLVTNHWAIALLKCLGFIPISMMLADAAIAQIIPDTTLGNENSVVIPNIFVQGDVGDRIDGGAIRGSNLFHSFEQFNINDSQRVYFANPTGIETILSRVTGNDVSDIFGTLGVDGTADLFFLNPNGIVFGENARLDVAGSFMATTADAFQFGVQGTFSATAPSAPTALLTIDPSALLFTQATAGSILNQSVTPLFPGNSFLKGLRVPDGERLALVGGPVQLEGGGLNAFGGRVDVGAVGGLGSVTLNSDGSLGFPESLTREDVYLNGARLEVTPGEGGDIVIIARNIELLNSDIRAGIVLDAGGPDAQAGDIVLNASNVIQIDQSAVNNFIFSDSTGTGGSIYLVTEVLEIQGNSELASTNFGIGNSGNILVEASDRVLLDDGSSIFTNVPQSARGNGGEISIDTGLLEVLNLSQLQSGTLGNGNAGSIRLNARDRITFNNSAVFSDVKMGAVGNGGNVDISTNILELSDLTLFQTTTLGNGNAGSINIVAGDRITLDTSAFIRSDVEETGIGNAGDINITTNNLKMQNLSGLFTTTFGQGNAGDIDISATDSILFNNASIFGDVSINAIGTGGNIGISSKNLDITNLSVISADTLGQGNAGNIFINVQEAIQIDNLSQIGTVVQQEAIGQGGDIVIKTGSLEFSDFSQLSSSTFGNGDAGQISITAQDHIVMDFSLISSLVFSEAEGAAGDIFLTANSLELRNFAGLSSTTTSQGNAGDILINVSDRVTISDNSGISSNVFLGGEGEGGDISITARELKLSNISVLAANSLGVGDAGNIILDVRDRIVFNNTGVAGTSIEGGAVGNAGNVLINTDSLILRNGSQLVSSTFSDGDVGNIRVVAREKVHLTGRNQRGSSSAIFASTEPDSSGQSGTIRIATPQLIVANGAVVTTRTLSAEDGGNIFINADQIHTRNGGQIITSTFNQGQAGNIVLNANDQVLITGVGQPPTPDTIEPLVSQIDLDEQFARVVEEVESEISNALTQEILVTVRQMFSETFGALDQQTRQRINRQLEAIANVSDTVGTGASGLYANTQTEEATANAQREESTGNGGDIRVQGPSLIFIADSAQLSAATSSQGTAGNIIIRNTDRVELANGSISTAVEVDAKVDSPDQTRGNIIIRTQNLELNDESNISASTSGVGDAGNISIREADTIQLFDSAMTTAVQDNAIGNGGRITIQTDGLILGDRAQITSTTEGDGQAGIITIGANSLLADQGSRIESRTLGDRPAGNIDLRVRDDIILSGNGSGVFASTSPTSQGRGGSIFIDSVRVILEDGAEIAVDSEGQGRGGDIQLEAGLLQLNDGRILAATDSADGGNITLSLQDLLLLDNNSQISAEAGRDQSGGDGGNINITAPFVVAIPEENSDIVANAVEGDGGRIDISTFRIFGMAERAGTRDMLQTNQTNDISASSQFGTSGVVAVEDLGIDPVQAVTDLPTSTNPPPLSQGCQPGVDGRGRFVNIEQGGIAPGPTDALESDWGWEDVAPIHDVRPDEQSRGESGAIAPPPANAIVEAEHWHVSASGRIVLSTHEASTPSIVTCAI